MSTFARAVGAAALLACTCVVPVLADERILAFESLITVRADSVLEVRETIRVRSEGALIRRGIYRDFPTSYVGRDGRRVVVGFKVLFAERDGRLERHRVESRANGKRVYLGEPDVMLEPGEHRYVLVYLTDRQLGFFPNYDELYWNVTGNGWGFPIDAVRAEVLLPAGITVQAVRVEAYTGPRGATGRDYTADVSAGRPVFVTTRTLQPAEGLTIVVTWPKGFVLPPSGLMRGSYLLRDSWPLLAGCGGLLALLAYYLAAWRRVGRDPPGRIVVPHYEPAAAQSPASMRFLLEMNYDDRCFAAAILSLAVKGYLTIEEEKSGLFNRNSTYTLARLTDPEKTALATDEQLLLRDLFASSKRLELKSDNHEIVSKAKASHKASLKQRFTPGFFRVNGGWHLLGIVISLLVALVAIGAPLSGEFAPEWFVASVPGLSTVATVLAGLLANGMFGRLLKAPTIAGRETMDRIRGLRLYLDVAEGDELKLAGAPPLTPQLYETNLPAALALGVEQRWAERFAAVFAEQAAGYSPSWYSGGSFDTSRVAGFSASLATSLDAAISSASSAPGSNSGSGGGGSSGGGGGGGGGGGW